MTLLVGERPARAAQQTAPRQRLDGLDVLRGAAVGAVLLGHSWPGIFQGAGIVGVIAFFVLSGYLITRNLLGLRAQDRPRRALAVFYYRRLLRIVPAYYRALIVIMAVRPPPALSDVPWYFAFASNNGGP